MMKQPSGIERSWALYLNKKSLYIGEEHLGFAQLGYPNDRLCYPSQGLVWNRPWILFLWKPMNDYYFEK